jgi:nuclear cap-binding protein subunit 1
MYFNICRLSYHQRIKDMMPESFESLIPAKPEAKFKYAAEGAGRIKLFH